MSSPCDEYDPISEHFTMTRERLCDILERIKETAVAVIGDFCLDAYWQLDTGTPELSLETDKLTQAVTTQHYSLGGAGNVAQNLVDLGIGAVYACGVYGDDLFGREMIRLLEQRGVNVKGVICQCMEWETPVFAKPYLKNAEQNRVDFGRFNRITADSEQSLLRSLTSLLRRVDGVIVNQQLEQGIHSKNIIHSLNALAADHSSKVFVLDSRAKGDAFQHMIWKLNASEAARVLANQKTHGEPLSPTVLKDAARLIAARTGKPVFITLGARGILVSDGTSFCELPGISIDGEIDTVGAGDTSVSAIAAALAAGATPEEAAALANLAAAVTVRKLRQTGTATPHEILDIALPTKTIA